MKNHNQMSPLELREKKRYSIFDLKYLWNLFWNHKKWFFLSWLGCLSLVAAYIYFSRPMYSVRGRMVIVEKRNSGTLMLQNQLPLGLSNYINTNIGVENEKEILKSKLIARDIVYDLGLHTEYYIKKLLKNRLLYKTQPINVEVSKSVLQFFDEELPLRRHLLELTINKSTDGYEVEVKLMENNKKITLPVQVFNALPAVVHTDLGDLTLTENTNLTLKLKENYKDNDYTLKVTVCPPMTKARQMTKKMSISSASKKAAYTVNLDILDENIMRGIDYVNDLIRFYNEQNNSVRREEIEKIDEFVNYRLAKIELELDSADIDWLHVKKQYQVTDPKLDAEEVISKKSSYESQLVNFGIQQQLLSYLSSYVNDSANRYELIPMNVGVYTGDAVSMISRHNQLVSDRKSLLKSLTDQSAQVQQITQLIDELYPVIQTAIKRDGESLNLRRSTVEREYNRYLGRAGASPEQERAMTEISRNRSIKQGVYMTLLQKREENALELANKTDKGRKIDETLFLKKTKPKSVMALGLSIILGFLLPYVLFFMRRMLKRQIDSEVDLKLHTQLPLAGIVSSDMEECEESFRVIRTNLLHLLKDGQKTILVTSADDGDGKTFCATHLAEAFARMGERTVLCDLNFRHPSVAKIFGIEEKLGMVSLLVDSDISMEKIKNLLKETRIAGLYVLPAGMPGSVHPADLIANKSLYQVRALLEEYDIVILDSSAVGKYTDVRIDGLADVTCYVCRSGKTTKESVEELDKMVYEKSLSSPCIVLNRK